jgi:hypothetical protein
MILNGWMFVQLLTTSTFVCDTLLLLGQVAMVQVSPGNRMTDCVL